MTLGKRLRSSRIEKKMTQKQLADLIGAKHNSISDWENDKNKPDPDTIELLCGVLGISPNYLLNSNSEDFSLSEKEIIKKYRDLDPIGQEHVNTVLQWETERMKSQKEEKPTRIISYYQRLASAGTGEYWFSDIPTDFIEVEDNEKSRNADFVIGVDGDSMKPVYNDGDKVFVKKTIELSVGEIGIFIDGNNCHIKELGENELISINKGYKNIKNSENVKVIGKVLGKVE